MPKAKKRIDLIPISGLFLFNATYTTPSKASEYSRRWKERNPEKYKEVRKKSHQKCKEKEREYAKKNADKMREAVRRWQAKNPPTDKVREQARLRYAADPSKKIAAASKWQKNNPEKKRAINHKRRVIIRGGSGPSTTFNRCAVLATRARALRRFSTNRDRSETEKNSPFNLHQW